MKHWNPNPSSSEKGLLYRKPPWQSLGVKRAWAFEWDRPELKSRPCHTVRITLGKPFNFSQLRFPHLKNMKIIMPYWMSQDFFDHKWQKPKSYSHKKKVAYWKTMGGAQRFQRRAGYRSWSQNSLSNLKDQNQKSHHWQYFLSKSLSLIIFHVGVLHSHCVELHCPIWQLLAKCGYWVPRMWLVWTERW